MGVELNRADLANHMGVSPPTIDAWRKDGMPVKRRGSKGVEWAFDLAEVIKWRTDRAVAAAAGTGPSDLDEIERRTKQAKMHQEELALAKLRGEVAPIEEFKRAQAARYAMIRANLMNVPARAVLQLLGETDEGAFKRKLKAEIQLALETAANAELEISEDETTDDEK